LNIVPTSFNRLSLRYEGEGRKQKISFLIFNLHLILKVLALNPHPVPFSPHFFPSFLPLTLPSLPKERIKVGD